MEQNHPQTMQWIPQSPIPQQQQPQFQQQQQIINTNPDNNNEQSNIPTFSKQPSNETILFPPSSPSSFREQSFNMKITEINSLSNLKILASTQDSSSPNYVEPVESCLNWSHSILPSIPSIHNDFGSVPIGTLFSPLKPLKLAPPVLMRPPTKCKNCSAIINCFCPYNFNNGRWQCVLCGALNENLEKHPGSQNEAKQLYPELLSPIIDYLDPQLAPPPNVSNLLNELSVFFLIDINLKPKELQVR
jgi:hypothetical protein